MRRSSRDPRSLMELRRLAYRARRSPEARHVLHDALLETFPKEYTSILERADAYSIKSNERVVLFFPERLKYITSRARKKPATSWPSSTVQGYSTLFGIYENPRTDATSTPVVEQRIIRRIPRHMRTDVDYRNVVLVYRARGRL